ncbi:MULTISPECIES: hypothetical protein [Curtobacterium]|uniref:hypothetical protein n=1 Tax=Curtobacterium TaxID=2034 RepID=UPI001125D138|nr:hypothetical protein [Curtobacterium flaccumfaciens]MCS6577393.1 hypothetical protein [Curtobacterium flaccumfaciens]TPG05105.1 hypothetical protein EAH85_14140 [Curtobacterium flaccumfaciens]
MDDEDALVAASFASIAVSVCEMFTEPDQRRDRVLEHWRELGSQSGLFLAAAGQITTLPQPPSETVEQIERKQRFRERYGMDSAEDQLLAAIDARALLQELAREFD